MSKYFFMSDLHSYASCMIEALKRAGFRKTSPDHILVICGDIFDRGFETMEIFNYLMSIPKDRRIMIKGNHELLYLELLEKGFPEAHDFSNGTVRTFCQIADANEEDLNLQAKIADSYIYKSALSKKAIIQQVNEAWFDIRKKVRESAVTEWLKSDEWVNYFEVDDLICVHSFIPLRVKVNDDTKWIRNYPAYQVHPKLLEVVPEWRTSASNVEWDDAMWGCPYKQFDAGHFNDEIASNPNKKLVCGHWHVSDFHNNYEYDESDTMNLKLYFGQNLIGLDACTAMSQFCNVLVYDQKTGKYFDQFKNELKVGKKVDDKGNIETESAPNEHIIVDVEQVEAQEVAQEVTDSVADAVVDSSEVSADDAVEESVELISNNAEEGDIIE